MTTLTRVRTDYVQRLHVFVDGDAATIDCFMVELPPYLGPMCVPQRDRMTLDDTWREALTTLEWLRAQPYEPLFPRTVFVPFGVITARNFDDVNREHAIKMNMMGARLFHTDEQHRARVDRDPVLHAGAHERRVAELGRAAELLNGAPLPVAVPFPDVPLRH